MQESDGMVGLIGLSEAEVSSRLGQPEARRAVGDDLWLVFSRPDLQLRVRCRADATNNPRVASWTATFDQARPTLASAAEAVGAWPAVAPDEAAGDVAAPLIRRPLSTSGGMTHSFTATVRAGGIIQVSVFDEAPDWA